MQVHLQGGMSAGHFAQNVLVRENYKLIHPVALLDFKPHLVLL
jgi:hypothetical protein